MKVAMLGWEYPPHISGGLGTACQGLTLALAKQGIELEFVVPHLYGDEDASHMELVDVRGATIRRSARANVDEGNQVAPTTIRTASGSEIAIEEILSSAGQDESSIRYRSVPALLKPYLSEATYTELREVVSTTPSDTKLVSRRTAQSGDQANFESKLVSKAPPAAIERPHYGHDLFEEVSRYAEAAAAVVRDGDYDLVHAHDWMTFPAGLRIAEEHGVPLITHVHSLEFDRAGEGGNERIEAIERIGVDNADRVVAVSYYTRGLIHQVHNTPLDKIQVVHNGVYTQNTVREYETERSTSGPVVLFLGRITFQKGPEYFIEAAKKVLTKVPDAKFVMAGSGDMLPRMKKLADELNIADAFRFPGFVSGADLERAFSTASVYVMPSVSEPFGIAPLEAMSYDRPVIVSKQSGVSEVLKNALKVDFWDTDTMASQIVSLIEFDELRELIVSRAREEIRTIHWDAAAQKLIPIYENVLAN